MGTEMDEPLEVRLNSPIEPLLENTIPVEVTPLRYTELIAETDPERVLASRSVGVLKCMVGEISPPCHLTAK